MALAVRVLMFGVGAALAGVPGALVGTGLGVLVRWRRPSARLAASRRLILVLLLVEVRSGVSVLAALQRVASHVGGDPELNTVARVATVGGLTTALAEAPPRLRPVVAQLARAQRSGSSLSDAIRSMIEQDIAAEKAARMARAKTLPVRLMIPVTLLMLPGLVLMLYAPTLLQLLGDVVGAWS